MVRDWITGLDDPRMIGPYDPIRSRLLNLSLLPKVEQIEWLTMAIELVKRRETVVREYEEQDFVGDARLYEILRSAGRKESKLRKHMLQLALRALQGS